MKIEFIEAKSPVVITFKDIPVGSTFCWLGGGRCLKVSDTQSYQLDPPDLADCALAHMNVEIYDVAEIESITLRRVK